MADDREGVSISMMESAMDRERAVRLIAYHLEQALGIADEHRLAMIAIRICQAMCELPEQTDESECC